MDYLIYDTEEDNDFNYFETDDCGFCPIGECDCYDDICCYDPRYTGEKGTCHCAEWHKEEERSNHWFFKYWDVLYYHHWRNFKHFFSSPIFKIKRYLFGKTVCGNCQKTSLHRKWKGLICPICKEEDLPF